jgi:hypothetical protein
MQALIGLSAVTDIGAAIRLDRGDPDPALG